MAIPEDGRVRKKEDEKAEKYQYLSRRSSKNVGCTVVMGALGSVPKMNLKTNLKVIGC